MKIRFAQHSGSRLEIETMTELFIIVLLLAASAVGAIVYFFFAPVNYTRLNIIHRYIAKLSLTAIESYLKRLTPEQRMLFSYEELMKGLPPIAKFFVVKLFAIDPAELGFKGPFYSRAAASDPVKIGPVEFQTSEGEYSTGVQFLPKHVLEGYNALAGAMQADLGRKVYVDSGYRSPGRQAYLFIRSIVREYDYSPRGAARMVAMPGYSEHGDPERTAVDFVNSEGINGFNEGQDAEDFERAEEYAWLKKNAAAYHFFLSYPRDNEHGVGFEPWHWHYEKPD